MNFTIDTSEIDRLVAPLRDFPRQLNFAGAMALTKTAKRISEAEAIEIKDVFDRPTPYTQSAIFVSPATPNKLEAVVGVKDSFGTTSGRAPLDYLRWEIYGGLRAQTAFEKALVRGGAMDGGDRAVPGQFAKLDAFGSMSRGQMQQILSQLRIDTGVAGSTRSLPKIRAEDDALDRRYKSRRINAAYRRSGGQFIALPYGRGKLRAGIYQVRATAWGRTDPRPVVIFVSKAEYEAGRFDFHYVAELTVQRMLLVELDAAVQLTLQTRRA